VKENNAEAVRLLLISSDPSVLLSFHSLRDSNFWRLEIAASGWEALERFQVGDVPDLLLLELPPGDAENLQVLRYLHRLCPKLPIVLLSHSSQIARESEAVRLGAQHVLTLPFEEKKLETVIREILFQDNGTQNAFSEAVEQVGSNDICFLGGTPVMQSLRAQTELLAQTSAPVLIVGEPGSGRKTIARLIHRLSTRSEFEFSRVDCVALPLDLLDRELFGTLEASHNTDNQWNCGKFEVCRRGTIFLDNVVEMPTRLQGKLLDVMRGKQLLSPGSERSYGDVRILASADINAELALSEKKLREDLYYCLSAFTVHVPPLRQRRDDIPFFLQYFMNRFSRHYGLPYREFSDRVLDACKQYLWPGNITELQAFVKRYLMIGDEELRIGRGSHPQLAERAFLQMSHVETGPFIDDLHNADRSLKSVVHEVKCEAERNVIGAALQRTGWNRKAAARLLKVSYRTMLYKIDQYHMNGPRVTSPHR